MRDRIILLTFMVLGIAQSVSAQFPKMPMLKKLVVKDSLPINPTNKQKLESLARTESKYVIISGIYPSTRLDHASWLGRKLNKEVYWVDMAQVVSKYIGETEKNLARIFDSASAKDWVLIFDEADALFGKRTNVRDSHDKYTNLEITYFMKQMEDYKGRVILSTKSIARFDSTFLRKFQVYKSD